MNRLLAGLFLALSLTAFGATAIAGPLCNCTPTIGAGDYSPCVGDTVEISARVVDCYCVPLAGKSVAFYSTRGSLDQILVLIALTDANGVARSRITTSSAGSSQVYAIVQGVYIGPSPDINWSGASSLSAGTWGKIKALFGD